MTGIGLSGQMHGATLLGADHKPLRPCILWNDGRSAAECRDLEARWPALRAVTGNKAMPGFTAPKLLWVASHEPEIFARIGKVLLPKAYVRLALTGEAIEDMSDAAGTLWLDVGAARLVGRGARRDRAVARRTCRGSSRARRQAERCGRTSPRAGAWRSRQSSRAARGDNAAGAVGLGAIRPGSAFVSLGTSGVLWATTDRFAPNPDHAVHAFCHAVPDTWHQMGVILSAASCLSWASATFGLKEAELLAPLGDRPRAPSPVALPALPFGRAHAA